MTDTQVIFQMDSNTATAFTLASCRRGQPIVVECPLYSPTVTNPNWVSTIPDPSWQATILDPNWRSAIPDPNWDATVDDGSGNQIPNPVSQGTIPNPNPQTMISNPMPQGMIPNPASPLMQNPQSPEQFAQALFTQAITIVCQQDIIAQADIAKIAADTASNIANEATRASNVAAAIAGLNLNVVVSTL